MTLGPKPRLVRSPSVAASAARDELVKQAIEAGFNTNYSSSWHMVRSGVLLDPATGGVLANDCKDFPFAHRWTSSLMSQRTMAGPVTQGAA